ncbi:MAG: hypothetical protein JWQ11_3357 [Rhizobacter sp.]|nr:hypothetical protein [Rhizobacter sp.]
MDASTTNPHDPAADLAVIPSEQNAQLALREARVLMAPVVRWLMRHGVQYTAFANVLKSVFANVAREELTRSRTRITDSAVSVLSGVHRKDVRALGEAKPGPEVLRSLPLSSQVFTKWITDAQYRDARGLPRALPRSGAGLSFETLARSASTDVHPRTVLDQLVRLGLVELRDEEVVPRSSSFAPVAGMEEMAALFAANAADHIAAAVNNLTLKGPKFLEQSVFADGLSPESADHLAQVARDLWLKSFESMVAEANDKVKGDEGSGHKQRVRFGVYFYTEEEKAVPETKAAATAPDESEADEIAETAPLAD